MEFWRASSFSGEFAPQGRNTDMSVVGDILAEPRAVILYGREDEEAVRGVMHEVVTEMAAQISVVDPLVSSLTVIDVASEIEKWPEWLDVTTPSELDSTTLHHSQSIVSLSPMLLRRPNLLPVLAPTRFYAITPDADVANAAALRLGSHIIHLEAA